MNRSAWEPIAAFVILLVIIAVAGRALWSVHQWAQHLVRLTP